MSLTRAIVPLTLSPLWLRDAVPVIGVSTNTVELELNVHAPLSEEDVDPPLLLLDPPQPTPQMVKAIINVNSRFMRLSLFDIRVLMFQQSDEAEFVSLPLLLRKQWGETRQKNITKHWCPRFRRCLALAGMDATRFAYGTILQCRRVYTRHTKSRGEFKPTAAQVSKSASNPGAPSS